MGRSNFHATVTPLDYLGGFSGYESILEIHMIINMEFCVVQSRD